MVMRDRIIVWLEENVPKKRIDHIFRVEQTAITLAKHHNLNPKAAAQAGLLHDLAKCFKAKKLLKMMREEGITLDPVEEAAPHLLHAQAGAIVARDEFGVCDREILDAVSNHTLGQPGMSPLSCIIFLADSLEPGRGDTVALEQLRRESRKDLNRAIWLTCDYTLSHLLETHQLIHPRAILTRNWFLQAAQPSQYAKKHKAQPANERSPA